MCRSLVRLQRPRPPPPRPPPPRSTAATHAAAATATAATAPLCIDDLRHRGIRPQHSAGRGLNASWLSCRGSHCRRRKASSTGFEPCRPPSACPTDDSQPFALPPPLRRSSAWLLAAGLGALPLGLCLREVTRRSRSLVAGALADVSRLGGAAGQISGALLPDVGRLVAQEFARSDLMPSLILVRDRSWTI